MEKTISVVCPYCHLRQPVDWEVGDSEPRLVQCGYRPITTEPYEGCFKRFVVSVEWITRVNVQAIQGEGDVLRG